jgi:hypothetical protein
MVISANNKHKNVIYSKEQLEVKENEMTGSDKINAKWGWRR